MKTRLPAFVYSASSANIDFYRGAGGYVAEVLVDALVRTDNGRLKARKVPIYRVTLHRHGVGGNREVARFTYQPATNPRKRLPDRTVTHLVRQHFEAGK